MKVMSPGGVLLNDPPQFPGVFAYLFFIAEILE